MLFAGELAPDHHPESRSLYHSSSEGEQAEAVVSLAAPPDASAAEGPGMS